MGPERMGTSFDLGAEGEVGCEPASCLEVVRSATGVPFEIGAAVVVAAGVVWAAGAGSGAWRCGTGAEV